MEKPQLRPVEAFPVEMSGQTMIALRDPSRIAPETLIISEDLLHILQYFDGRHSISDIQSIYRQQYNVHIPEEQLQQIIVDMDQRLFLESPSFRQHQQKLIQEYRNLPYRPMALAGQSYSLAPEALREELKKFFVTVNGQNSAVTIPKADHVKGLILPHIDIQAGGETFALGYDLLAKTEPVDLFVILGTGHNGINNAFACSNKDFETPLGMVKTDKDFLEKLQSELMDDIYAEEILHKSEHTIEFQTVFLQYLFGNRPDWEIVPILCSFNTFMLENGAWGNKIRKFIQALKKTMKISQKKICVLASADLAHIGRRYGDQFNPDEAYLNSIKAKDIESLQLAGKMNTSGFLDSIRQDEDERRVCGFPPIYTMLETINAKQSHLLHYNQVAVDNQNSTVSFASMVFF